MERKYLITYYRQVQVDRWRNYVTDVIQLLIAKLKKGNEVIKAIFI